MGTDTQFRRVRSYTSTGPLAELHAHLGASISPAVLWQIAHDLGIKLPKTDFIEFSQYIMLSPSRRMELNEYFKEIYGPVLDRLSSGTHAVEQATYHTMTGAYQNGISLIELRNNPMKHNANASLDLDHIIMSMVHGMERALLENKKLSAGLIFCLAREFDRKQNEIIIEKAIKYHKRGVVGVDVAGPITPGFHFSEYADLFSAARDAGLNITVHAGEVRNHNDMWEALEYIRPQRIGHGIHAAYDKSLMKELVRQKIVLEVCPLSNLATKAVENMEEMRFILRTFVENKVRFCISTDWPEVIENCHLPDQIAMLHDEEMLTQSEIETCNRTAFEAAFVPKQTGLGAYLI